MMEDGRNDVVIGSTADVAQGVAEENASEEALLARCRKLEELVNDGTAEVLGKKQEKAKAEEQYAQAEVSLTTAGVERERAGDALKSAERELSDNGNKLSTAKEEYIEALQRKLRSTEEENNLARRRAEESQKEMERLDQAIKEVQRGSIKQAIAVARKEDISAIGELVRHFQELAPSSFRSVNLSAPVDTTTGRNNGYILMAKLPETLSDRIGSEWFSIEEQAKHTYCDGDGRGSLKDLVAQKFGTTYPRETAELWGAEEGHGRARRR